MNASIITKTLLRIAITFITTSATFYFVQWLGGSWLLPRAGAWVTLFVSSTTAAGIGYYVWTVTKAPLYGLFSSIIFWAVVTGGICFIAGFVGPIIFMPKANQGPLIGFFTGPLGFILGGIGGFIRWSIHRQRK